MGKEFNLNIGASEDAGKGKGSSGFSFKHTMNMKKAFGKHLTGTDVMSDGYYNQVNKVEGIEGGGSGINMNVPGPMYNKEPKKDEFGTEIPEDFVDDSGRGGVTGTLTTKDTTERREDYQKGREMLRTGDKATYSDVYRGGKKAKLEVVDDGRDSAGRKKAGQTGKVTVKKKKGDITFS